MGNKQSGQRDSSTADTPVEYLSQQEWDVPQGQTAQDAYCQWDSKGEQVGQNAVKHRQNLHNTMRNTLRNTIMAGGDLRQLVKLPMQADRNDWLALNTIHFYKTCAAIFDSLRYMCTKETCPMMSAGVTEYLWRDNHTFLRPTRICASDYIEFSLKEAMAVIENADIFPTVDEVAFPPCFMEKVREIFKRLFRMFAHLYYSHYESIKEKQTNKNLNSSFKHFIFFVLEFQLIDPESLAPLQKFIEHIVTAKK